MRVPVVFVLLAVTLLPACIAAGPTSSSDDNGPAESPSIQEGQVFVPAVTKDNNYPIVTVDYAFAFDSDRSNRSQNQLQQDMMELQQVNADGIIALRIRSYLLDRMAELSFEEFASMVNENPSNNQLTDELKEQLSTDKGLNAVQIQFISLNYE